VTLTQAPWVRASVGLRSPGDQPRPLRRSQGSDISLASRALSIEEGQVHRLGQQVRRDILHHRTPSAQSKLSLDEEPGAAKDGGKHDSAMATEVVGEDEEPQYLKTLREKLEALNTKEGLDTVQREGWEEALRRIGATAEELTRLETEHPESYAQWRQTQLAAEHNAWLGRRSDDGKAQSDAGVDG